MAHMEWYVHLPAPLTLHNGKPSIGMDLHLGSYILTPSSQILNTYDNSLYSRFSRVKGHDYGYSGGSR